jgi:uncharacterized membrane protein
MQALENLPLSLLDWVALLWFLVCWLGYSHYVNTHEKSLMTIMAKWRDRWAMAMLKRDNRIMDSQVIMGLSGVVTFFCSTSLFITAGLFAAIATSEKIVALLNQLSFVITTEVKVVELKLALMTVIFIYAFFKFAWSMMQHSYSAVILASVGNDTTDNTAENETVARLMSRLSTLGAQHFNDGVRSYYFALSVISWFIHPMVFILVISWVILVLYRRDFYSKMVKHLHNTI